MHLGSLESAQEARVALGCASSNSYASFVLSKLPACIPRYTHAKHEPILKSRVYNVTPDPAAWLEQYIAFDHENQFNFRARHYQRSSYVSLHQFECSQILWCCRMDHDKICAKCAMYPIMQQVQIGDRSLITLDHFDNYIYSVDEVKLSYENICSRINF